jgi:hypothetical protein
VQVCELAEGGHIDLVLCMTVTPGFGGQKFQPQVMDKVSWVMGLDGCWMGAGWGLALLACCPAPPARRLLPGAACLMPAPRPPHWPPTPAPTPTRQPPQVRALRERFPDLDIMCDGGVNPETSKACAAAGANAVVAGTAVFCSKDGPAAAIASIRAPLKERFGA